MIQLPAKDQVVTEFAQVSSFLAIMLCVTSKNLARFQLSELWPDVSRSLPM